MAAFFTVVVILLGICGVTFIYLRTRSKDTQRLDAEMSEDFSEEFELDEQGQPSEKGMEEMVEWLEDDLRESRLVQSVEIESFQELPQKHSDDTS
jgi:flagellar biosynthesis/type III secretory pathway M-ring protein FliF/YscJ